MNVRSTVTTKLPLAICTLAAIAISSWAFVSSFIDSSRDYAEAEHLVTPIWNLATCMNEFTVKYGRSPSSIEEIAGYHGSQDYSALESYDHEFRATGPTRFHLRVNKRFAFSISEDFTPQWTQLSGMLDRPQNLK